MAPLLPFRVCAALGCFLNNGDFFLQTLGKLETGRRDGFKGALLKDDHCRHCMQPMSAPKDKSSLFCCLGCERAFSMIKSMGLDRFYDYRGGRSLSKPSDNEGKDYSLFDVSEFIETFSEEKEDGFLAINLHVSHLTCYGCVWVLQRCAKQLEPRSYLDINLATGRALLTWPKDAKLSHFIEKAFQLGYKIAPLTGKERLIEHKDLLRLGASLFALCNIMIFALCEYLAPAGSLPPATLTLFRWIQGLLASFSLFYGGYPLITAAFFAVKAKKPSIDLPLVVALLTAYLYSFFHLWQGDGYIYFDSIAAIIALILLSRMGFKAAFAKSFNHILGFEANHGGYVRVAFGDTYRLTPLEKVAKGEKIKLLPGELLGLSARLVDDHGEFQYESMTGEPHFRQAKKGEIVKAGAKNGYGPVTMVTIESGMASHFLLLKESADKMSRQEGSQVGEATRLSFYFNIAVLGVGLLVLFWPYLSLTESVSRVVALFLLACPCAFGFGGPLIRMRALAIGLKEGVVFKSQKALEQLAAASVIYFDKTGTLTSGTPRLELVKDYLHKKEQKEDLLRCLLALKRYTAHHTAPLLYGFALDSLGKKGKKDDYHLEGFREIFGEGVEFQSPKGSFVRVGRAGFCGFLQEKEQEDASLYVFLDDKPAMVFRLQDQNLPESYPILNSLKEEGYHLLLLSGDQEKATQKVAKELGVLEFTAKARPQDKLSKLKGDLDAVMVGNGMNDALALSSASVGITVQKADPTAHKSANINLIKPGLSPLYAGFKIAKAAKKAEKRTLLFALSYNSLAGAAAICGFINPVAAALMMPVSSLCVMAMALSFGGR